MIEDDRREGLIMWSQKSQSEYGFLLNDMRRKSKLSAAMLALAALFGLNIAVVVSMLAAL
jgi:hypothetical protein